MCSKTLVGKKSENEQKKTIESLHTLVIQRSSFLKFQYAWRFLGHASCCSDNSLIPGHVGTHYQIPVNKQPGPAVCAECADLKLIVNSCRQHIVTQCSHVIQCANFLVYRTQRVMFIQQGTSSRTGQRCHCGVAASHQCKATAPPSAPLLMSADVVMSVFIGRSI